MQTQTLRPAPFRVAPATTADAEYIAAFLRALPAPDAQRRFGGRPDWLIDRLFREAQRGATIARLDGELIGRVDDARTSGGNEIGVVVAAQHRRRGIASALLAATLERIAGEHVVAYASRD